MRIDDRFLDEIKARLRLSDVIGKTVKLRRQGREYVGLSPFTKERTPSFFVNDDKGFFHDFSSGKHGDLISFLQETERLSFHGGGGAAGRGGRGAAAGAGSAHGGGGSGAPGPRRPGWSSPRPGSKAELRRPAGRAARDYLIGRGLPESDWARFRLGLRPRRPHGAEGLSGHQGRAAV